MGAVNMNMSVNLFSYISPLLLVISSIKNCRRGAAMKRRGGLKVISKWRCKVVILFEYGGPSQAREKVF